MANNKHTGSDFADYMLESLRESDESVFLHVKVALENPDIGEPDDFKYLIKAIADVAKARGKFEFAEEGGITRQELHKILKGNSVPSIQNITALLSAIGLNFSIEQVGRALSANNLKMK